jgi:hypothetical protein
MAMGLMPVGCFWKGTSLEAARRVEPGARPVLMALVRETRKSRTFGEVAACLRRGTVQPEGPQAVSGAKEWRASWMVWGRIRGPGRGLPVAKGDAGPWG